MCTPEIVMSHRTQFGKQWVIIMLCIHNICGVSKLTYQVNTSIPTPGKHLNAVPTNIMPPVKSIELRRPEMDSDIV